MLASLTSALEEESRPSWGWLAEVGSGNLQPDRSPELLLWGTKKTRGAGASTAQNPRAAHLASK